MRQPLRARAKLGPPSRVKVPLPKKVADPFYTSPAWRSFVERLKVARFGSVEAARCEDTACREPGAIGVKVFADHCVELKDGGAPLHPGNILFRCFSCHSRVTAERRARRYGVRP
jgi:5-methylcytosine-specific restriction protein A